MLVIFFIFATNPSLPVPIRAFSSTSLIFLTGIIWIVVTFLYDGSAIINLNKLTIATGTTTLGGNINATSDITINSGSTLNASTHNITLAGNFTDNGTFNCNTSTVDFDNNGNQCVSGSHSSETFQNLTVSALSKLGTSCIVNIDGTILILPGGHMACVCH